MYEYVLSEDILNFGYDEFGNTHGIPRYTALKPIKLKWSIPESVWNHLFLINILYELIF